jgi:hypothetical protein
MGESSLKLRIAISSVPPAKCLTDWDPQVEFGFILGMGIRTGIHVSRSQWEPDLVVRSMYSVIAMAPCTLSVRLLRLAMEVVGRTLQLIV